MTLRHRLILLHSAFAVFAVGAAIATIYVVQLEIGHATKRFETLVDDAQHIESFRGELRTLDVHLHEIFSGARSLDGAFEEQVQAFLTRLGEVASFSGQGAASGPTEGTETTRIWRELEAALADCLRLQKDGDHEAARRLFKERIEDRLFPALDVRGPAAPRRS